MKIVVAPDSFKESLSAPHAAEAIINGFSEIFPSADYHPIPLADGGEGTVAALVAASGGRVVRTKVHGARMTDVDSFFGILSNEQTAVIEVAAACGLEQLTPSLRNPKLTTSYGVGELIIAALDQGVSHILVGLGGTASNDAGSGMLQALGAKFLDAQGHELPAGGAALGQLVTIDFSSLDPRLKKAKIDVAYDVDNVLCGPNGASFIFGAQKGADHKAIIELDNALNHFAKRCYEQYGMDLLSIEGGGAAGGLGAAFAGILNAVLSPGVELLMDALQIDEALQGADLVITGEGRIDGQSLSGKTPFGVAQRAKKYGVPVIAIGGSLGDNYEKLYEHGITAIFSCVNRVDQLSEILASAETDLISSARNIAALWKLAAK
ncbi:glycerate kinase [Celerinatantimonas diazotrophica]|uniref:Glycerate kinase n=1 Tax=Celerinatantimonas diazotrophica TaxID=412034 RepID=A0A4R1KDS4_9GAMM|nr:glycerate kinase [Celerinatantimonas diazotrophica]TCK62732.1 glycerate kinase [Celerinatantimonas diazotrophica]CAG9298362.1 Glycerate 3-kinase [Celerinatantimonas diazotrophica]